ncbi:MAG: hypothetical protein PF961_12695 [Planctomycetota bacterium]|jgi:hypothetical protein|nr:hypothetical protein [Planctomycetota bacterium]
MSRAGSRFLFALLLVLSGSLLAWNLSRFVGAKPQMRVATKLNFLPRPALARAMAMGHTNTLAKLRWINSFDYFAYQVEAQDDAVAGGTKGGFRRLYESLIALDPLYLPYYEHAVTTVGGIMGNHEDELYFTSLGVHNLPFAPSVWAMHVATLQVFFDLEERDPAKMEGILERWAEQERLNPNGDPSNPQAWLAALARRHFRGLGQVTYWGRVLATADKPTAPQADLARSMMQEQLARHGEHQLQALVDAAPSSVTELKSVLAESVLGLVYASPRAAADPAEPIGLTSDGSFVLRADPYGVPYRLLDGKVQSEGLVRAEARRRLAAYSGWLLSIATSRGAWPKDLDQARAWLGTQAPPLPEPPGELHLVNNRFELAYPGEDEQRAWTDEDLIRAADLVREAPPQAAPTPSD